MSSEYMIRTRLAVLFLTLVSLALAGLNATNARFAVVLRERAKPDHVNTANSLLNDKFRLLQVNVLACTLAAAIAAGAFAIYGLVIIGHPRWLPKNPSILLPYLFAQAILALIMIFTGGFIADNVHGFKASFEIFGASDNIPYYGIMYYGGVAQAAYGSVLTLLFAIIFTISWMVYY